MVDADVLAAIPLFASLDATELKKVAAWCELREVSERVELVGQGAPGYSFFVLVDGSADVTAGDEVIAQLGPGDFFGEGAIVGDGRRHASVATTAPSHVLVLFGTEFRRLEQAYPEIRTRIDAIARDRLAAEQR